MRTTNAVVKVLIIEDDEDDVLLVNEYLEESENYKFEVEWEPVVERALVKMTGGAHDVLLIDYRLGSRSGLDLIKFAQDNGVITPCILLTGQGDRKVDLDASRYGAADYLVKTELNASMLERSIRYALSHAKVISELDEKERRYRSLFQRSIDPIFLANNELMLVDVNEAFLKFFKCTSLEARTLKLKSIFMEESDYEHFRQRLAEVEQVRDFEVIMVSKENEKRVCLVNCVYIPDQTSAFCCYQGIIHDQTMRRKAEKDMLVAERLSLTGKIARTIAHEVRNPLTNLNLALEQLKDELPRDNDSVTLYSDIIRRNSARIEQLIGEMLNSSKPRELDLELLPVMQVLEDTIGLTIDRLNLNQIKLQKDYAENLPRVLLDPEKIKIAFLNIIINAIEAMEPGDGELRIGTRMEGEYIVVSIEDNGKGIAREDLEKLFDPFYTGKQGGMGLGLTSARNIFNSHNATVEVDSTLNRGTNFMIFFKSGGF